MEKAEFKLKLEEWITIILVILTFPIMILIGVIYLVADNAINLLFIFEKYRKKLLGK